MSWEQILLKILLCNVQYLDNVALVHVQINRLMKHKRESRNRPIHTWKDITEMIYFRSIVKNGVFNRKCLEIGCLYWKKMDHYSYHTQKINSRRIKDLNIEGKSLKLQKKILENIFMSSDLEKILKQDTKSIYYKGKD